jgi:methyl-accepting chemotaxis protein
LTSDLKINENSISEKYESLKILPDKYKNLEENKSILVFPIIFRTNQMGFCVFGMGTRDGMIYENMVLQLSNTVQRIQLLEHIQITEAELLRKNQKIEDLITPMLKAFEDIKSAAIKESAEIDELIQISKVNISTIEKAVAISGILEKALVSASDLVRGIDDISETVNMVALNASIEAAHAGSYGRGFKVIASEIRKLSDASRINAENIGRFLSDIGGGVTEFVSTIGTTRTTFDHLMKVISETAESFRFIVSNMDRLTGNSDTVLKIMLE